jgi:hypothetical protein
VFGGTEYTSASSINSAPVEYNNSSGNWRFADVQIDGPCVVLVHAASGDASAQ